MKKKMLIRVDFPGADVDWILSGTGSVSTGSAKSRCQLNAAQRLEMSSTKAFSPNKWSVSERSLTSPVKFLPNRIQESPKNAAGGENPWTMQKNRTEFLSVKPVMPEKITSGTGRFYKTKSIGNLSARHQKRPKFRSNENLLEEKTSGRTSKLSMADDKYVRNNLNLHHPLHPEEVTWALVPVSTLVSCHLLMVNTLAWVLNGHSLFYLNVFRLQRFIHI